MFPVAVGPEVYGNISQCPLGRVTLRMIYRGVVALLFSSRAFRHIGLENNDALSEISAEIGPYFGM